MDNILLARQHEIAVLRLNNGDTNAINPELVKDFTAALKTVAQDDVKGMVLCGGEKFFSIGLDVPLLLKLERAQMATFMREFNALCMNLYTLPMPTCCAMTGHAVAGGYILGLTCDNRMAAAGTKRLGLNEVQLGVPVPYPADMMLRQIVGDRTANMMLWGGALMTMGAAREKGLIDTVVEAEEVENTALAAVSASANLPQAARSAMKATRAEKLCRCYEKYANDKNEVFLDCWFSETAQKLLHLAAEKF